MDNIPTGGGSFGQATGGGDALRASMQRRGIDTSVLDSMSPGSTQPTQVPPEIPQDAANVTPTPAEALAPSAEGGAAGAAGGTFRSAENEIALKALASVVKTENKIAEQALKLQGIGGV